MRRVGSCCLRIPPAFSSRSAWCQERAGDRRDAPLPPAVRHSRGRRSAHGGRAANPPPAGREAVITGAPGRDGVAGPAGRIRLAAAVRRRGGDQAEPARGGVLGARPGGAPARRASAHGVGRGGRGLRGRGHADRPAPGGRIQRHAGDLSRPRADARRCRGGRRARPSSWSRRCGPSALLPSAATRCCLASRTGCAARSWAGSRSSDIEASSLAHMLTRRVLVRQYRLRAPPASRLDARALARVAEAVEARLTETLALKDLAEVAGLSPFHFARSFRAATGLAPHQYVLARRIELAKRLTVTTRLPVQEIAWSAGFENISHFRRQFAAQVGVLPGDLRRATGAARLDRARPPRPKTRAANGGAHGTEGRDRGAAERRQVDALQRADPHRRGAGGELPVLHHRAERRRGERARRAARPAGGDREVGAGDPGAA